MIPSIFSSIVKCYPDNKAVVHNKKSITYREIDFAAGRLAVLLKTKQVFSGMIIALYLPSSIEAIVSMLGVLKAGYAYLPLDINDPPSRTEEILDHSQADIIITLDSHKSNFKNRDIEVLVLDTLLDSPDGIKNRSEEKFNIVKSQGSDEINPDFTAYVIYTSGSTGKPKGIPVKHQAVMNLIEDFQHRSPLDTKDKSSLWTNLNFDVSVYEIWSALLSGATLFIPDQQIRSDADKFIQWLKENNITSSYIPPFMIKDLADKQLENPISFKRILTGVEPIPESLLCALKRNTKGLCLINGYGPAESTICATLYEVPDYSDNPGNAPIGKPVKNLEVYLLDESGNPVKNGEKGEIYIAGIQVADGYLREDALSAKNFLENSFSDKLPGFLYKTGDLGTRLKTGDILFGGRKDFQIKLRGFRIEPWEIENVIKEFPGISQTAVVLKENKAQRKILTAYIDSHLDQEQLINFLKSKLPKYMIPSVVIPLEKMPLTSQDKIDRKNLMLKKDLNILKKEELPQTKTEEKIAEIWAMFLGISPIYRTDDFLLLGGDSISGVKIVSRINRLFLKNIEINTLFEHSQLKAFSRFITGDSNKKIKKDLFGEALSNKDKINKKDGLPLLDDQNLIWMFEQINPGTSVYHIPLVYKITGKLNYDFFEQAIEIIKERHIALQSVFLLQNDITIQKQAGDFSNENDDNRKSFYYRVDHIKNILNHCSDEVSTSVISCVKPENTFEPMDSLTNNDLENRWILDKIKEKFNLETGPVFRTDLLITGESSCLVCFTFHHIIFDGWSAGLFAQEFGKIYNCLMKGESLKLSTPEVSYHDYILARIYEVDHDWKTARPFFASYLKDLPQNSKKSSRELTGACFPVKIDADTYNKIKKLAIENRTTSFTVLLALFQILLFAETGQNDQITGIAYAARDNVDTEPIIGFLMNTLVVRTIINIDNSLSFFLDNVKKNLEKIFRYKNIPFQKINRLCQETSQREKVFESMFLMQTMDFPHLDLYKTKTDYLHVDTGKANCDITLELYEGESGLTGWFEYRTDLFTENRIKQVTKHFNKIIDNAIDQPESKINTLLNMNTYPISPMQHGMLMETLRSTQGAGIYIEQIVFDINQDIDLERFKKAWQKIIQHHEIMRLGFVWKNLDQPRQHILPIDEISIEINDWSSSSKSETEEFIEVFLQADRRLGFALSKPPLFRIALLKTDENQYTCVWSFHHAIADGRTMVSILKDLFLIYHNPNTQLSPPGSFKNYIGWLNKKQNSESARAFWEKQLNGFTESIDLPFNIQKRSVTENRRQEYSITITTGNQKTFIPFDKTSVLKKICEKNAVTMNSLLMGAWAVLLSHYTGKKDIVFGTTRSVRSWRKNSSNDTGLYINTLPLRVQIDPEENLSIFLHKIRNEWIKIKEFEHTSLSNIHSWSQVKGSFPLFDIFFAYDYHSIDAALEGYKEKISCSNVSLFERTPASLFLTVRGLDELTATIEYDRRKFDPAIIKQVLGNFTTFLESLSENVDPRLMDVSILTDLEKKKIARKLNSNKIHTRPDSCIHHLVEIQASLNKDTTAVTDHKNSKSYDELNRYANQIAHYLIKFGAMAEKKVVLLLEQNADLIAVILGVLKSGCAYVPLDPGYPDERINYIINDSAPEIIVTTKTHEHRIDPKGAAVILLDKEMPEIKNMGSANPKIDLTPENMAYIIYTSGSTGKPKGVMVEHSSLVAFTRSASEIYDIRPDDRVLQFASISFDASAEEIFPTFFSGATLVMKPRDVVHTPSQFIDFCRDNSLTVLDLPTSYWHMLADEIDTLILPEHIKLIIIGGDEANSDKVEKWNNKVNSNVRLLNTYGPTETTVAATWADLSSEFGALKGKVSIGLPFPNVSLCILNQFQQPALPGSMGELCIGGTQTARGYLNREDLTAKSFVKLNDINKETIFFRTGDRVEMPVGEGILFYGRIDRQIKIRGFRVEPGEIERTALLHPSVSECAVAVSKECDGNIKTAAFLMLDPKSKPDFSIKAFKQWLLSKLPEYMVPSLLITVDFLPYTSSGKIDYNALEIPRSDSISFEHKKVGFFDGPYEKELKAIWEGILNYEVSSPDDNFFDIGGSSLYSIKLVNALEKKFNISIPVIAVFKASTIRQLAKIVEKKIQDSLHGSQRIISKQGKKSPVILIGHSIASAQKYKKVDLKGHPFYHSPIFIHFYDSEQNGTQLLDIWQLAQKCIDDILKAFPSGPYIIIGSCKNTIVAHEIACQLTNMNKKIELLVIIDENWEKKQPSAVEKNWNRRGLSFVKKQFHKIRRFDYEYIFNKIISKCYDYYISLDGLQQRLYTLMGKPVPESVQFRLMESIYYRACELNPYMPIPYYGNVLLFYSRNWEEDYAPQLHKYHQGQVKKIDVKTTHSDWFKPEQINKIIGEIEAYN
ncbi:non-ribosomal peptide synthetase [Desulfobacula toluolica]|uniref:Amino acid adenylation domain protein n=1 Tax=Desulfobacula toluolica (strain DSM 7467 / Tol2) TaxID=651182 RepID=K0NBR9_DESTT|nr:non-ribosomal peptide synthetase [Desulfobacula toluolica]CCK81829.1 amino acid adenylation domain protein [Desulfobacula toluolica Tol2]